MLGSIQERGSNTANAVFKISSLLCYILNKGSAKCQNITNYNYIMYYVLDGLSEIYGYQIEVPLYINLLIKVSRCILTQVYELQSEVL